MKNVQTPVWLLREDVGKVPTDGDAFLRRSYDALGFVLNKAKRAPERSRGKFDLSTRVKLALTLIVVFCASAARNFVFVEIVGVAELALIATFDAKKIVRILTAPIQACLISAAILAPAIFWGQTRAFCVVPWKTLVSTVALALLAYSTNWNRFTCAFKSFGAPDALVFVFDLTLKYVVVLSDICLDSLDALRLRSVGRDRHKAKTLGGVVGVALLRAQKTAQEQFDAMTCRCFSGKYSRFRTPLRPIDFVGVALCLLTILLFVYLERAIRCSN